MKIAPSEDRLVVQATDPERRLASGIIIPETATNQSQDGIVTAIGPIVNLDRAGELLPVEQHFNVGDHVLYSKFGGIEIELRGEKMLLLRKVDILGTVTDADDEADLPIEDDVDHAEAAVEREREEIEGETPAE